MFILDSNDLEVRTSRPLKVGNDMKLICRHNCTSGTPRWDKDKPVGRKLTYNGCVQRQYINKITLDNQSNEYNLIFKNVTFADINSSYTCHYGYASKQIRPIEDYEGTVCFIYIYLYMGKTAYKGFVLSLYEIYIYNSC